MRFVYPASPIFPVFSAESRCFFCFFLRLWEWGGQRGGQRGKVFAPRPIGSLCVSEGAGRRKGDLGRQRGLLLLTAPLQARQAISRGDGRNAPAIVLDSDLHTRAAKSQTN